MRILMGWRTRLIRAARQAGLQEAGRTLIDAELGLYLLARVDPQAPCSSLWAYLSGYQLGSFLRSPEVDRLLATGRHYLVAYRTRRRWEQLIRQYAELPEDQRLYQVDDEAKRAVSRLPQLALWRERLEAYAQLLAEPPRHMKYHWKPAPAGRYVVVDRQGAPHDVEITPQDLEAIPPLEPITFLPPSCRPPQAIPWSELVAAAQWLDKARPKGQEKTLPLEKLLNRIQYEENDGSHFCVSDTVTLTGTRHVVGMVGAGKTTLMRVLGGWAHLNKRRIALIVGDVASAIEMANWFRRLGIEAVPVLGYSGRSRHIAQIHRVEQTDGRIPIEAQHEGHTWTAPVCALMPEPSPPGEEPCRRRLRKPGGKQAYDCPFFSVCPVHTGPRMLMEANVWITTPQAFIHHQVSPALMPERMRLAELIYRYCDQVVVDECDRVQVQLDSLFSPEETLIGNRESLLDRLSFHLPKQVVNTPDLVANRVVKDWLNAFHRARSAAQTLIYRLSLRKRPSTSLREEEFFTAWSMLAIVAQDLAGRPRYTKKEKPKDPPPEIARYEEALIDEFTSLLEDPLGTRTANELGLLALRLAELDDDADHARVLNWVMRKKHARVRAAKVAGIADDLCTALVMMVLENALQELVGNWDVVASELSLPEGGASVFRDPASDFRTVMSEPAPGTLFGFQYSRNRDDETGVLRALRLTGNGRDLLLRFPRLYQALDGVMGPNLLLISGTSWAPDSARFHIQLPVHGLLRPLGLPMPELTFNFLPVMDDQQRAIWVSGKQGEAREQSLQQMTRRLVDHRRGGNSQLEREYVDVWKEQRAVLLVVGSYLEARVVYDQICRSRPNLQEKVELLVRDAESSTAEAGMRPRGMVSAFARSGAWILIAPLQAIERGHNIVDEHGGAFIGSAYFLVRPMPRVDDLSRVVVGLNRWVLEYVAQRTKDPTPVSQVEAVRTLRRAAFRELFRLLRSVRPYAGLDDEDRQELLWSHAVMIWQTIGRLVRGGSSARVFFVDAAFAPGTADSNRTEDTPETSFLHGLRWIFSEIRQQEHANSSVDRTVAEALYEPMIKALTQVGGLD